MHKITDTLPVRTRLPLAAWAVAAAVTLASLMSSLLHAPLPFDHAMPSAEQGVQPKHAASGESLRHRGVIAAL
ncbi:MAG: hypothetical protein MUO37_00940 [Methyloceanibacter sp.]|nr:hypothetical protein [Methyloceanibacter sp.]